MSHQFFAFGFFILVAKQVQRTMDNYPLQLIFKAGFKFHGVLADAFNRNKDIADDLFGLIRIIKGNDIRIGIMIKVLLVYLQQILVGAEDIIKFAKGITLGFNS